MYNWPIEFSAELIADNRHGSPHVFLTRFIEADALHNMMLLGGI